MTNQAGTNLRHICDRELRRRNRLWQPASFKVGDLVLVHHSRLPPGHVTAYMTFILGPIVSSGYMDPGSMSGAVHVWVVNCILHLNS